MANYGEKVKSIREAKEISRIDFAKMLGVSVKTMYNYETGATEISANDLKKISSILDYDFLSSNLSSNTSNSVQQKQNLSSNNKKSEKMKKLDEIASGNKNKIINLRFFDNVSAAAGYGANNDDESFEIIEVTAKFLSKILRVTPQEYDVISVLGDSMEPLVKNGDMVLVKPTCEASNGEIVIANLGGDLYVKKLLRDPIKRNVRLTSMNNFYEDIVIEEDELEQLNIVGVVKKVMSSNIIAI